MSVDGRWRGCIARQAVVAVIASGILRRRIGGKRVVKDEVVDGEKDDDDRNDDCRDHGGKGNGFCGTVLSVVFRHFALTGGSLFGFLRRVLQCGGGARTIFLVPLRQIASFAHFSEAVLFRCGESPGAERCGVAGILRAAHLGDPEIDEMSTVCSDDDV